MYHVYALLAVHLLVFYTSLLYSLLDSEIFDLLLLSSCLISLHGIHGIFCFLYYVNCAGCQV